MDQLFEWLTELRVRYLLLIDGFYYSLGWLPGAVALQRNHLDRTIAMEQVARPI